MTLEDIENIPRETLKIREVAEYLQCNQQSIRSSIRCKQVPWGYIIGQSKYIIPKRAFVHWHKYGNAGQANENSIL
jgi:hypothetical protein